MQIKKKRMGNKNSSEFNKNSTSEDVIGKKDLTGKVYVITGTSTGIGEYTAKILLKHGGTIIGANRNPDKSLKSKNKIIDDIIKENNTLNKAELEQKYTLLTLDLSSLQSVQDFMIEFNKLNVDVNVLINNAGIMALPEYNETKDGIEKQWGVNHLGHFYLTNLLMDNIVNTAKKCGEPSRIVNLSSSAAGMSPNITKLLDNLLANKCGPMKKNYKAWRYILIYNVSYIYYMIYMYPIYNIYFTEIMALVKQVIMYLHAD